MEHLKKKTQFKQSPSVKEQQSLSCYRRLPLGRERTCSNGKPVPKAVPNGKVATLETNKGSSLLHTGSHPQWSKSSIGVWRTPMHGIIRMGNMWTWMSMLHSDCEQNTVGIWGTRMRFVQHSILETSILGPPTVRHLAVLLSLPANHVGQTYTDTQ